MVSSFRFAVHIIHFLTMEKMQMQEQLVRSEDFHFFLFFVVRAKEELVLSNCISSLQV